MSDERLVGSLFHMVVGFLKMCMIISIYIFKICSIIVAFERKMVSLIKYKLFI